MPKTKGKRRSKGVSSKTEGSRTEQKKTVQKTEEVQPAVEQNSVKKATMDPRSKTIVFSLMGSLLVIFLFVAIFAPDPTSPEGTPKEGVIFWRLLFLMIPLGIMYALLWGGKVLKFIRK